MLCLLLVDPASPMLVPLSMLVVFASAKFLAEIFERMNQPGIIGEILAGILIGPYVLGWLAPNQILSALSDLGAMFLLFRIGLEVKSSELLKVGGTALLVAVAGVALPLVGGAAIALLWGLPRIESMFIGAAMVATSVGITAQVLGAKGLLSARASKLILAAAVIDDVLGLIVLAIVSSVARGKVNVLDLCATAVFASAFTFLIARWGTPAIRLIPRVGLRLNLAEAEFALSMCLLFALSLLAVYAGVAAIVGAFLAGMALSETVEKRVHDLTQGVAELLIPFFLVGIGLRFNLSAFATPRNMLLALTIFAVAVLTKFVGCGLAALSLGRADAIRVGVGMVPRGEVGMVVAQIGLALGVVAQGVFGLIVFMSIATTVIAPPLLGLVFRSVPRAVPDPAAQPLPLA